MNSYRPPIGSTIISRGNPYTIVTRVDVRFINNNNILGKKDLDRFTLWVFKQEDGQIRYMWIPNNRFTLQDYGFEITYEKDEMGRPKNWKQATYGQEGNSCY